MTTHRVHKVRSGERLSTIAAQHGRSTLDIVRANPQKPAARLPSGSVVFAALADGEELLIPGQLGDATADAAVCLASGGTLDSFPISITPAYTGTIEMCRYPTGGACNINDLNAGTCNAGVAQAITLPLWATCPAGTTYTHGGFCYGPAVALGAPSTYVMPSCAAGQVWNAASESCVPPSTIDNLSTTEVVAIGAGVVGAVGLGLYFLLKPKKKER